MMYANQLINAFIGKSFEEKSKYTEGPGIEKSF